MLSPTENGYIEFVINEESILELRGNGDIFVKGNLIENDKAVVDGLREWLKKVNNIHE